MKFVGPLEAEALLASGGIELIDVREPSEFAQGHLPGAKLVPLGTLRNDKKVLPKGRVLFVCAKGGRSESAGRIAEEVGLTEVFSLDGGTEGWAKAGLPLEGVPTAAAAAPAVVPSVDESEAPSPEFDAVIGLNLRALREQRGVSLDVAARQTGVSRSQLGQIELGTTTPSVETVWKIASGFGVPFATLLAAPTRKATTLLRQSKAKRLLSSDGRFASRALFPFGEAEKAEFYELWLAPRGREEAEAHQPGTRENLVVTAGKLELTVGTNRYELEKGDAIVFTADVPHVYANLSNDDCWMHLVMTYPSA